MFKSIKTKLLTVQIGFVLIMAVVLGLVTYFIMFKSLRNNRLQHLNYVTKHVEQEINTAIDAKERSLEKIAASEAVMNYTKKQSKDMLLGYFSKFMSEFDTLAYVNEQGAEEIKLVDRQLSADILNETESKLVDWLKRNPNEIINTYLGFSPETRGPCLEFGIFKKNLSDEFVGIILAKVSVDKLAEGLYGTRIGETGSVILLDSEGTVLFSVNPNHIHKEIVIEGLPRETVEVIKGGGSGVGRAKIFGVDSYFTYGKNYKQSWTVIAVLPCREFTAELHNFRNMMLLVCFNVLLAGAILSLIIAKGITKPISELVEATATVAKGEFVYKINATSRDEIGTLAESFNQMSQELGKNTTSIASLNHEVEVRKKIEASLRNSERRFEEIAENSGDWIWEVDAEGLYIYSNSVVEKILGYKPAEVIGKKYFYDFFTSDGKEELKKEAFEGFARHDEFHDFVNVNVHKNGDTVILETNATPIVDEQGKLLGYRGVDRDITDRKKVEEEINRLAKFPSEDPNPVLRVTKDGVLIYANDASKALLNFCGCEVGGRIKEDWRQLFSEVFASGVNKNMEAQFGDRTFSMTLTPLSDAGYLNIYGLDITDRKKAEEHRMQLLEKLERTNRELNEFVYIASHDLRTPLRGIATLASWIATDFAKKLDDDEKEKIYLLMARVDRMYKLLVGILRYSKLSRTGEEKVAVDLNKLVTEIVDAANLTKNIKITIENKLPSVECVRTSITQVFESLIDNAVKYMDKPNGLVSIACIEEENCWKFSVADNGPGIEEKYFEKIFQIFQTLSFHNEADDIGMGLALVKKVVEMHDGEVWVESKPGQGSTFCFTLPKQKKHAEKEIEVGAVL